MKLRIMKVKEYRFGNLICIVNEDDTITPQQGGLNGFVYKNEEHMLKAWGYSKKKLHSQRKRLIKVYEDGLEIDITPHYKE